MANADSQDIRAELQLLSQQLNAQLEAHRLEISRALDAMTANRTVADNRDTTIADGTGRPLSWERREAQLSEQLATKTTEFQALRANAELDRLRQQVRVDDLQKQLALRDAEYEKLKSVMAILIAEHTACISRAAAVSDGGRESTDLQQMKAQLENAELECDRLRHLLETSLALRLARSIPWILRPLRSLFVMRSQSQGPRS
jgi:hypothetical protein